MNISQDYTIINNWKISNYIAIDQDCVHQVTNTTETDM